MVDSSAATTSKISAPFILLKLKLERDVEPVLVLRSSSVCSRRSEKRSKRQFEERHFIYAKRR
jgi:hypothetical protein